MSSWEVTMVCSATIGLLCYIIARPRKKREVSEETIVKGLENLRDYATANRPTNTQHAISLITAEIERMKTCDKADFDVVLGQVEGMLTIALELEAITKEERNDMRNEFYANFRARFKKPIDFGE